MKKGITTGLAAAAMILACGTARAQDERYEKLKEKILRKLEAEIKEFYQRLEQDLRKTIREELAKLARGRETEKGPKEKTEKGPEEKKPGYLGILADRDFTDEAREKLGLKAGEGILIEEVRPGTPAEKAGLKAGMVIVQINEDKVTEESMRDIMKKHFAGETVKITVLTPEGKKEVLEVTLGER